MQRRNFLKISGLSTLSAGLVQAFLSGQQISSSDNYQELSLMCEPTTADILGPYYRSNSPLRSDLVPQDDPTPETVYMEGKVIDSDCNPIEGASVELWQASNAGDYDNSSPEFLYRGTFITNENGSYYFRTVVPGHYLNGGLFRPRHLHFRITKQGYKSLVTQIYFENDPYIPEDQWASDPAAALRIIPLNLINTLEYKYGISYEFTLDIISSAAQEASFAGEIRYNNPITNELIVSSISESLVIFAAELLDIQGKLILSQYRLNQTQIQFKTDALRTGLYFLRVKTNQGIGVFRVVKSN